MKKFYESPLLEIEKFTMKNDVMTTSDGIGDNGEVVDPFGTNAVNEF